MKENKITVNYSEALLLAAALTYFLDKTDQIWTDTLFKRQQRDKIKNQYCISNNIPLYRIPYWEKTISH